MGNSFYIEDYVEWLENRVKKLSIPDVISRLFSEIENEFKVKGILFMTYRKGSDVLEFYEINENEEKVEKYLKRVSINDLLHSIAAVAEFRLEYPETVGETDIQFDLENE